MAYSGGGSRLQRRSKSNELDGEQLLKINSAPERYKVSGKTREKISMEEAAI
jgi:hypothetical protein